MVWDDMWLQDQGDSLKQGMESLIQNTYYIMLCIICTVASQKFQPPSEENIFDSLLSLLIPFLFKYKHLKEDFSV